jgi:MerR family copper efflux transcriptional regulator
MDMQSDLNIGQASLASGVSAKMMRYYESIGLIPPPSRSASNYRHYTYKDVHTLRFVRRARDLGFNIDEIIRLLDLWRDNSRASADVKRIALGHVARLRVKLIELTAMVATLEHLAQHCNGNTRPECPIIDDLSGKP